MTLAELDLLTVAQQRKRRRDVIPMATLIMLVANYMRNTEQRFQPYELPEVLGWLGVAPEPEMPEPTPASPSPNDLRDRLRLMAQMYPPSNGSPHEGP